MTAPDKIALYKSGMMSFVKQDFETALAEFERALEIEDAGIGVNNRDLDTLAIDTSLSPRELADVPRERVVVAESGYEHAEDVAELRGVADAVLVGSALMKLGDPTQRIQEIRG